MIVLDSDDYLNPWLAKEAHKQGIDMEFMVNYVGAGSVVDTDFLESEVIGGGYELEDIDEEENLMMHSTGAPIHKIDNDINI